MIEAGIIDPAEVVRVALQDAGPVAALIGITEVAIVQVGHNQSSVAGGIGG